MGTSDLPLQKTRYPVVEDTGLSDSRRSSGMACPACGCIGLSRVHRRPIDRLLSLFVRLRRFRCTHVGCQWQGNLREPNTLRGRARPAK